MPYLNVVEVESALSVAASAPYATFTEIIPLPKPTWEGRQCHAIKIASGTGGSRPGVYFLGGVHAREWGSPDILINFVEQLEQAYANGTSLTFGSKTFTVADIQTIVNTLDIIVFPQANPDGRNYSMNTDHCWRKNRRTAPPNSAACPGVDINRNFDILWDFPVYFSPAAAIQDSTDPCNYQYYRGPSALSEPETQNAKWIFDTFPNVGFFVDLHSSGENILHSWGDDQDQTTDPSMNFQNPTFNGMRGVKNDAYGEYIPGNDLSTALHFANVLHDGIQAFRGKNYTVESGYDLYPVAGTSDDYAYSRHFVDPGKQNVISYTVEWGREFHPLYPEMQNIIQEITCGLLTFCLELRKSIIDCVVITDRNTFGKDEVDALLHLGSPVIPSAFYVIIDGFSANELGITAATFSGFTPNVAPNISFNPVPSGMNVQATACSAPDENNLNSPQRFTWSYEVVFADDSAFTAEQVELTMTASMTSTGGITVSGQAVFLLTTQPDPYETDGPNSALSVDLQVFSLTQGFWLRHTPNITLGSDPINFIQRLLANHGGYNDPTLARAPNHPFDLDLVSNEDHSTITLAQNNNVGHIYNFAVARVRYRSLSTPAPNVRVFFRMFQMSTTGTDFQPTTTYATGGLFGTKIPLLGVANGEVVTIPFFATPRVDPAGPAGLNAQEDPTNVGPLHNPIPPDATGNEVQVYFGCWLDINQPTPFLPDPNTTAIATGPYTPVHSIQQAIRGQHQCLVAEINLDPPEPQISPGSSPATSDKLAQRNLYIVGVASPHQVPVTFDVKPTHAFLPVGQTPDEIMIDWGNLPRGTKGNIYLPGTDAKSIIAMADRMYSVHGLSISDPHTLICTARGITYMPIPPGAGSNFAGLMTVDLPVNVNRGAAYKVITRQLTNISAERPTPPPPVPEIHANAGPAAVIIDHDLIWWRRVLGAFQITIPVKTKEILLEPEERLLSVLRYIFQGIPQHNRWYPVFQRYLQQIAGRVIDLGGDPGKILPSSTGDGAGRPGKDGEQRVHYTGKISGLIYDRFGDFTGFRLDTEDGEREFSSREKHFEELAARAWRERLRITVSVERHAPHRPESIIVREPPAPFRL
jgi:murein tripeptide amidase MpaA